MEDKENFYMQLNENFRSVNKKIENIKIITTIKSILPFPNMPYSDELDNELEKKSMIEISQKDELFFLTTKEINSIFEDTSFIEEADNLKDFFCEHGCVCKLEFVTVKEKTIHYVCNVIYRAKIESVYKNEKTITAKVVPLIETNENTETAKMLLNKAKEYYFKIINYTNRKISGELSRYITICEDANDVINKMAATCELPLEEQYRLNIEGDTEKRLDHMIFLLITAIRMEEINKRIDDKIRQENEKRSKEMYIREKIKYLSQEINEGDELSELVTKIKKCKMPKECEEIMLAEVNQLKKYSTMSVDYSSYKNHIDTVMELPWNKSTVDNINIEKAKQVLDEDHYGLEKIKTRILEYLAVLKLNNKVSGQILCFVGAPGVGKTSIVKSIAKALNRKFVKLTLGGVSDESLIRGHRKTYVGSMCGRIMYSLKNCGSLNPVFLLDEIDKIKSNAHGDPSSALLEVLDPEQNDAFRDNYIELPFDLSRVIFIATANNENEIPEALHDRMEIINVDSYTSLDKLNIAKNYLIKKQCTNNGIKVSDFHISDKAIQFLVDNYTYEAGIRNLERLIAKICRHIAVLSVEGKPAETMIEITNENIPQILKVAPNKPAVVRIEPEVGTSYGLGWSPYGGSVLTVECVSMPGKGEIEITGNLKDVMRESVKIAYTVAKHEILKQNEKSVFNKNSLHINLCEGATKKDGPSAGGALTLSIYSAITNKKIRNDFAMTGEISLSGNITAIGGLREKVYACVSNNVKNIIVPMQNKKDIEFLPLDITGELNIHYVNHISEIIKLCIINV